MNYHNSFYVMQEKHVGELIKLSEGFNSMVIHGAWTLWSHRNNCVFKRASPSIANTQLLFNTELGLCELTGAKKLQELGLGPGVGLT